jgi:hypothetical protein
MNYLKIIKRAGPPWLTMIRRAGPCGGGDWWKIKATLGWRGEQTNDHAEFYLLPNQLRTTTCKYMDNDSSVLYY